jgi:hypothetical protein
VSSHLKMSATVQRAIITFCVFLRKSTLKKRLVCEWHKCFRDGRASVSDDPPYVRLQLQQTAKILSVYAMICEMTEERVFRIYQRK